MVLEKRQKLSPPIQSSFPLPGSSRSQIRQEDQSSHNNRKNQRAQRIFKARALILGLAIFSCSALPLLLLRDELAPPNAGPHVGTPTSRWNARHEALRKTNARGDKSSLALAVLTHPYLPQPAVSVFLNMLKGFSTGRSASNFTEIIVYYDGRRKGPALDSFLRDFEALLAKRVLSKLVEAQFDASVHDAVGLLDPDFDDAPLYALFQFLTQDCTADFCAFMDNDVMVHDGGGLFHAVEALQQCPEAIFCLPPLGSRVADFTQGNKLQQQYPDADGNFPYMHIVGLLPPPWMEVKCREPTETDMSTRYLVAEPNRFRQALPLKPVMKGVLEEHKGLYGRVLEVDCRGTGYLLHPPPWHMGKRLWKACGIASLQAAVDNPESLAVDMYNNMIEQSWTEACKHKAQ